MKEQSSFREKEQSSLAGEFCVVDREFSDPQCLMNTLIYRYTFKLVRNSGTSCSTSD